MRNKPNILLFSPYLPAIDTTACARSIYDRIKLLNQLNYKIYLFSFCSTQDKEKTYAIRQYCAELYLEYVSNYSCYPNKLIAMKEIIPLIIKDKIVDILQCEKAYMSKYIPKDIDIPFVLVEHDILSVSFIERAKLESNIIKKAILYTRTKKKLFEENRWYRIFNKIIVLSENDRDIIFKLSGIRNIEVIPLGINLKDYPLQEARERLYDIIFVGNLSHWPNVDAVLHFYNNILPLIKNKFRNISMLIAGADPPYSIRRLAKLDQNILVTGYVRDLIECYNKCKIFISPVRYGGGMSYKILEAMALNMPIVSTSIGARGIIFNSTIKIASTNEDFANAVIELLGDGKAGEFRMKEERSIIDEHYNWETLLNKYEKVYYSLSN